MNEWSSEEMEKRAEELGSRTERGRGGLTDMPQEAWIGQVLNTLVKSEDLFDLGEEECAFCWARDIEVKVSGTPEMEWAVKTPRDPLEVLSTAPVFLPMLTSFPSPLPAPHILPGTLANQPLLAL